jgi:hypothetical protein
MAKSSHQWSFFRAGGVDQVVLEDGDDIAKLAGLDKKLWVALACPTKGLDLDEKTLALVDTDGDGRVRPPEILAAIEWTGDVLKDIGDVLEGSDSVPLASINGKSKRGKEVLAGARRVLKNLGKADADAISLADVSDTEKLFAETRLNGDGVVPAASAENEAARKAIEDVIATVGSVVDRSGKPGIDKALVTRFFDEAVAWLAWRAWTETDEAILPVGPATDEAGAAVEAVRSKVDDYFTRCRLAALDPPAVKALNATEADFAALSAKEISHATEEIARLPIARVEAGRALPLDDGINPAWLDRVRALSRAVEALLGPRRALAESDWEQLSAKLASHRAWKLAEPVTPTSKLGAEHLRDLLSSGAKAKLLALVEEDAALAPEFAQLTAVEQMVRYHRDLGKLLRNFVTFSEFFSRKGATFQAGTLFLDGRSCDLCLWVEDPGKHAALAGLAQCYLVYCECTRKDGEKRGIVAAFTNGDTDAIMVGRNGVFYDRKGQDWDATITKIVENPISIREAFWSPYKRFIRFIEEQVSKRAAAAEAESSAGVEASAGHVATADKAPAAAAALPAPPEKKVDVGTVAAIGVAVAGLATFLTAIIGAFFGLGFWMPIGLLGLVLAISGPSMLVAWLKLRQRNLGPVLDASGWAINGRMRVNIPFGRTLTDLAELPRGARRSLDDPYAESKPPWVLYTVLAILILLGVLWLLGRLDAYLPDKAKADTVLHRTPAAASAPAPATASPTAPAPSASAAPK